MSWIFKITMRLYIYIYIYVSSGQHQVFEGQKCLGGPNFLKLSECDKKRYNKSRF
jgi:hypothetical protein